LPAACWIEYLDPNERTEAPEGVRRQDRLAREMARRNISQNGLARAMKVSSGYMSSCSEVFVPLRPTCVNAYSGSCASTTSISCSGSSPGTRWRKGTLAMSDEILITVTEAARRLGLGRSATYVLIQRGELLSIKIGGSRRVAVADLAEFVERLRAEASEEVSP